MNIHLNNTQFDKFFDYLKFEKRYSIHTLTSYKTDLHQFLEFCLKEFNVDDIILISPSIIRSWLASLKENNFSEKSLNRKISTLKSFYKFLKRNKQISVSPLTNIISPKIPKRLPSFIDEKDIKLVFEEDSFGNDYRGKMQKLIIELFYTCGIRLSELINLKLSDIDYSYCQIKVLGKGNKERIIPINKSILEECQKFATLRPQTEINNFFISPKGKPLQPRYIYGFVKSYLSKITTIKKKSPHVLRHSFATHLMNNGAELNAVKELLGHSSLAATQVYTHNSIEKLKEVFAKAHPKA